jgi:hypothetical protein
LYQAVLSKKNISENKTMTKTPFVWEGSCLISYDRSVYNGGIIKRFKLDRNKKPIRGFEGGISKEFQKN